MRPLTSRENKILILSIVLILVFIGYKVVFKSFQEKDFVLEEKIQGLELRLKKNLKILARQTSIDEAYTEFSHGKKQTRSDEQEMTFLLSQIESVANEMSMRVSDMKPQKVRGGEFYNQFSVSLAIEGELVSILHFVYLLENQPYNFNIEEIRLERSFGRSAKLRCRLKISRVLVL